LEKITPSSFQGKKIGQAQYTVLTNEQGGIVDDLIVTKLADNEFYLVVNAGCKEKDIAWIKSHLPAVLQLYQMKDHALIAVQGPWAERVVHEILGTQVSKMPYMTLMRAQTPYGTPIFISRLGYTGEDGFEVSIPNADALEVWDAMLKHAEVEAVGLAARDSLRLEMGYCLYGHEINDNTTPLEAGLSWIMRKDNQFIGGVKATQKPERKRVGIKLLDKGVAREGAEIRNEADEIVGALTSGGFSPSLKESIGMGYVPAELKTDEKIFVNVRGRNIPAEIATLPFLKPKTKSMKKAA
jgi:aminomethyltransferase